MMESRCVVTHYVSPDHFYVQQGNDKQFEDFMKFQEIIQQWCTQRENLFHSTTNVTQEEVLFFFEEIHGMYARGKVIAVGPNSCDLLIMDYGREACGVTAVLKVDPSVKRFTEIPGFARRMKLAYIKPVCVDWTAEASEMFHSLIQPKMIVIPTQDQSEISLIIRNGTSFSDLSELLVQAGHAQRVSENSECQSLPLATSQSNQSLKLNSVGIQTESEHILIPPDLFNSNSSSPPPPISESECDVKHDNTAEKVDTLSYEKHVESCSCLLCSVQLAIISTPSFRSEKIKQLDVENWEYCERHIDVLKAYILKDRTSESQAIVLDILLNLIRRGKSSRRRSMDSSTQASSSLNRMTMTSCDDNSKLQDDITIIEPTYPPPQASEKPSRFLGMGDAKIAENVKSRSTDQRNESFAGSLSQRGDLFHIPSDFSQDGQDIITITDSEDSDSHGYTSDSTEETVNLSAISLNQSTTTAISQSPSSQQAIYPKYIPPALRERSSSRLNRTYPTTEKSTVGRGKSTPYAANLLSRNPVSPGRPTPASPGRPATAMASYSSSKNPPSKVESPVSPGFGLVMYCTFCGSINHRSANCPDGTKNLFL